MTDLIVPENTPAIPINLDDLRYMADGGWKFCKVKPRDKKPFEDAWQKKPYFLGEILDHVKAGGNVGALCGEVSANQGLLDVDEEFSGFCAAVPELANGPAIVRDGGDKGKILIRIDGKIPPPKKWKLNPTDKHPFMEWLSTGNQGVIPPSIHPDGMPYRLIHTDQPVPILTPEQLSAYCLRWAGEEMPLLDPPAPHPKPTQQQTHNENGLRAKVLEAWPILKVFEHFGYASEPYQERDGQLRLKGNGGLLIAKDGEKWSIVGMGKGWGGASFEAWQWCRSNGVSCRVPPTEFYHLLVEMAREAGIEVSKSSKNGNDIDPSAAPGARGNHSELVPEDKRPGNVPILLTDLGNSRRFAAQFSNKAKYTHARGWLVWNGKKWEEDKTGQVMRLARETIDELYREAERKLEVAKKAIATLERAQELGDLAAFAAGVDAKSEAQKQSDVFLAFAVKSQSKQRFDAMISYAQSEPGISARAEDFDKDPWLLNVQNGVLDLRTGQLKPHDPGLLMSKIAGTSYVPNAKCPTWLKFLDRIFSGDTELIGFMQRAAGYSLTGDVGEQCLFFLYGTGANGKSTFTGALQDILGDYSMKTRAETLMVKKQDQIPEEVAQLAGVRFMLAAELGEGLRLNEALIKDLTGGDKLRARMLYRDSFEFYPCAKPWLYGNHKPNIRGTDEGIWRRPKLVPFTVTIPPSERDTKLPAKLHAELPGILAWAVEGCLEWQQRGSLNTPSGVMIATAQYRAEQDILASFLEDCCIVNDLASVTQVELYTAYDSWAKASGLNPFNKLEFGRRLTTRGFTAKDRQPGTGRALYRGVGLLDKRNTEG